MSDEEKIAKLQLEMNQSVEEETDRLNEVRERRKNLSRRIRRIELKESPTSDEEDQVYEMKDKLKELERERNNMMKDIDEKTQKYQAKIRELQTKMLKEKKEEWLRIKPLIDEYVKRRKQMPSRKELEAMREGKLRF